MKIQIKSHLHPNMKAMVQTAEVFIKQACLQFIHDNCPMRAASLAYATLLSIVPLITVSFTVMTAFPFFKQLGIKLQNFVFQNFVATSAEIVEGQIQRFVAHATNLSATGMIFLVVTAVFMLFNMEQAFNVIWRIKRARRSVSAFMMYWGLITFVPILIGIGFAVSSYFFSLPFVEGATVRLGLRKPILTYFPYLLTFTAFSVLYITLPNCKILVKHAAYGGLVATILFEFAKYGFSLYVLNFPTYELLYGTLAAIPIFLVWIYVSWLIILFGAVVAHVAGQSGGQGVLPKKEESM
jgi:membrane protein